MFHWLSVYFICLITTRNFIVNVVESDIVYLQNKTIGDNHTQMDPTYRYRAWYKAFTRIEIGNLVTPKTDPGDYIIEKTGEITVYAGESVVLKPGFHAQNGSKFHVFIKRDCAQPPMNVPVYGYLPESENIDFNSTQLASEDETKRYEVEKYVEVDEIIMANEPIISDGNSPTLSDNNLPKKPARELPQENFVARLEEE
jgi:hypothetical protein